MIDRVLPIVAAPASMDGEDPRSRRQLLVRARRLDPDQRWTACRGQRQHRLPLDDLAGSALAGADHPAASTADTPLASAGLSGPAESNPKNCGDPLNRRITRWWVRSRPRQCAGPALSPAEDCADTDATRVSTVRRGPLHGRRRCMQVAAGRGVCVQYGRALCLQRGLMRLCQKTEE